MWTREKQYKKTTVTIELTTLDKETARLIITSNIAPTFEIGYNEFVAKLASTGIPVTTGFKIPPGTTRPGFHAESLADAIDALVNTNVIDKSYSWVAEAIRKGE